MAMTTQLFQTWKPEIDQYIQDEQNEQVKSIYEDIYSVDSTNRLQISEITNSGFGPMVEVGEMGNAVEDSIIEGYRYNYVRRVFRKEAVFSSDILETDQTGKVKSMSQDLVRAQKYTRDLLALGMIRNSWNQSYLFGDGASLVSTIHALKNGQGTQSNTFTAGSGKQLPLSYANAITLRNILLSNVTNSGNLMSMGDQANDLVLFGSYSLQEQLFQIAGIDGPETRPDTADRANNFFIKGANFTVLSTKFLGWEAAYQAGDTTVAKSSASNFYDSMWGIMDRRTMRKYFKFYQAEGYPQFAEDVNKRNQSMVYFAYDKFVFGNTSYLGFVASKGDNSTYAS